MSDSDPELDEVLFELSTSMHLKMASLLAEVNLDHFPEALYLQKPDRQTAELIRTGRAWLALILTGANPQSKAYEELYRRSVQKLTKRVLDGTEWEARAQTWLDSIASNQNARQELAQLLKAAGPKATTDELNQWFTNHPRRCMTLHVLLQGMKQKALRTYLRDQALSFPYELTWQTADGTSTRALETQWRTHPANCVQYCMRTFLLILSGQEVVPGQNNPFPSEYPYFRLANALQAELGRPETER